MLSYYREPALMTSAGKYGHLFDGLPRDITGLARIGHGLLIHEHLVGAYGVTLSDADRAPVHLRRIEQVLEQIVSRDDRPLSTARTPDQRVPGNCRQFTVLLVSILRTQGVAARARCGFGGYFGTGAYEDHWVAEYFDSTQDRWILVDGQIDEVQQKLFPIDFELTDVPRDRFVIAGDAWAQCRAGKADPDLFGLKFLNESGYWWIAGNLMREAAALVNIELLPWDVWGAMPAPDEPIDDERAALFDRLAALTLAPDENFAELAQLVQDDSRLRVPPAVRNELRDREETL